MLDFDLEQHCYGCGACEAVCPKSYNNEGEF